MLEYEDDDIATLIIHTDRLTTEQFDLICQFVGEFSISSDDAIGVIYEDIPIVIKGNLFELSDIAKDCYKTLFKAQMVKNMTVVKREE